MTRNNQSWTLGRRGFLQATGISAAAFAFGTGAPAHATPTETQNIPSNPFGLGVASGEPRPNDVVLWTRLAPEPLDADGHGGMPTREYTVRYEVATDENFRGLVAHGQAVASPELAHSVHPEVGGLDPGREYFYRFRVGREISPVGRTKTAPATGAEPESLKLALASCQAWYHGHFTAYRDMADQDLDLVVFVGDYIYEYGIAHGNLWRQGTGDLDDAHLAEIVSLAQYRLRYALFKHDQHLMNAHAHAPWLFTPDDHEVKNFYASDVTLYSGIGANDFLRRRAVAYRAMYEHLPLAAESLPSGPDMRVYRNRKFGTLAEINVLDTRQYRSSIPEDAGVPGGDHTDPERTILGFDQEEWLYNKLRDSSATWNMLAQQVPVTSVNREAGSGGERYDMDKWDGFTANRDRMFDAFVDHNVTNPVALSGDIHRHMVGDLKKDFADPDSATIGSELVATSIASNGDGVPDDGLAEDWLANPHVKFYNAQRGYVYATVTPTEITAQFRVMDQIEADDTGTASTKETFVTEAGNPGLHQ